MSECLPDWAYTVNPWLILAVRVCSLVVCKKLDDFPC